MSLSADEERSDLSEDVSSEVISSNSIVDLMSGNRQIHLWYFIFELLQSGNHQEIIEWEGINGEFVIKVSYKRLYLTNIFIKIKTKLFLVIR